MPIISGNKTCMILNCCAILHPSTVEILQSLNTSRQVLRKLCTYTQKNQTNRKSENPRGLPFLCAFLFGEAAGLLHHDVMESPSWLAAAYVLTKAAKTTWPPCFLSHLWASCGYMLILDLRNVQELTCMEIRYRSQCFEHWFRCLVSG